jgi:hypothetical protein
MIRIPSTRSSSTLHAALLATVMLGSSFGAPAHAGTVYVGLVVDIEIGGVFYTTQLRVTNTSDQPLFFITHFIPTLENGTERSADATAKPIGVSPGQTFVFTNLTKSSQTGGMLEITGDDELFFTAVLLPRVGSQLGLGSEVPIIGSEQIVSAGQPITLQGVRRDAQRVSNLALLNLSQQTNHCTVDLFAAGGGSLMNRAALELAPLSHHYWPDVLSLVGVAQTNEARFEITCSAAAYAFAQTVNLSTAAVSTILRSPSLYSTLVRPL